MEGADDDEEFPAIISKQFLHFDISPENKYQTKKSEKGESFYINC